MTTDQSQDPTQGFDFAEIFYALLRQKWKILFFAVAGFGAAAFIHFCRPAIFESEAKLLVRYVLDRSAIDSVESKDGAFKQSDSVISSEVEILTSWDLAMETAEGIGVERLVAGAISPASKHEAAKNIRSGLTVTARPGSNVIVVSYQDFDPKVATIVLQELVRRYFAKHLEVHRSTGAFDFVTHQTEQVRTQLRQTEEQLMEMKSKAGIISIGESTASLTGQLAASQTELLAAQAKRSELIARVQEIERWVKDGADTSPDESFQSVPPQGAAPNQATPEESPPAGLARPSSSDVQRHQALHERIAVLRQSELELLSKFTPENEMVKVNQAQIQSLDSQRRDLETRFPSLAAAAPTKAAGQGAQPDLVTERAGLAAVEAKLQTLQSQVSDAQEAVRKFSDLSTHIAELERKKEVAETNYKYFESSLEKARIDEALDPTKMPNISIVQKPSMATQVTEKPSKITLLLAGGGLGLGIGIALLLELVIDRSVKRPSEIETRFGIPLLRSIPFVTGGSRFSNLLKNGNHVSHQTLETDSGGQLGRHPNAWETGHFIRPYCDALRDRMVLYFEVNGLTHKPKLLGVTGCSAGAGTSTIAAGLAASLSETGDGRVLLVDMNVQQTEIHSFFDGIPTCPLIEAIKPGKEITSAAENLYLATARQSREGEMRLAPKRFYELLPSLKASDFDYIVFDMPPLSHSGAALAFAGLMDKVLLVIEAEGVNRSAVKRAYEELLDAKANVAGVVNKARSYAPKWFGFEN
jgi:uncharacterized protein involved in exopolysaccharide biosynthesis/Mrp family chromosome partitioning ATPase